MKKTSFILYFDIIHRRHELYGCISGAILDIKGAIGIIKIICSREMSSAHPAPVTGNLHDVPGVRLQHYAQTLIRPGRPAYG